MTTIMCDHLKKGLNWRGEIVDTKWLKRWTHENMTMVVHQGEVSQVIILGKRASLIKKLILFY